MWSVKGRSEPFRRFYDLLRRRRTTTAQHVDPLFCLCVMSRLSSTVTATTRISTVGDRRCFRAHFRPSAENSSVLRHRVVTVTVERAQRYSPHHSRGWCSRRLRQKIKTSSKMISPLLDEHQSHQLNVSRLSSPAPATLSTALDVQTISLHLVYCSRHYRHPPGCCACAIRRPRSTSCLRGRRHQVPCTVSSLYLPPTQGGTTRIETR